MGKVYDDPIKNAEKRRFHVYVAESATIVQPNEYFQRFGTEPFYTELSQNSTHTALTPVQILQLLYNGEWIKFRAGIDMKTVREILTDYRQELLDHGNESKEAEALKELLSEAIDILQNDEDVKLRLALSSKTGKAIEQHATTIADLLGKVWI